MGVDPIYPTRCMAGDAETPCQLPVGHRSAHMNRHGDTWPNLLPPEGPRPKPVPPSPADLINHPPHYTRHPSGVECVQITEHMGFNLGNAVKYIWRADEKGTALDDLKKARWYVEREIARRERAAEGELP